MPLPAQPPGAALEDRWAVPAAERNCLVIVLGIILLIIGFIAKIVILWTIGIILLVIGLILALLGFAGREIFGRRHWF